MKISRKQARRLLMSFIAVLLPLWSSAQRFEVGGIYYSITSSSDLTVGVYQGHYSYATGNVVIPSTVTYGKKTYSVTSIGSYAFNGCSSLTAITIPEGVTFIGSGAFYKCSSLTSITIPENSQLTSIGYEAFCKCTSLTSINIPENSQLTSIGKWAFYSCSSLTSITLPESVTSIGEWVLPRVYNTKKS